MKKQLLLAILLFVSLASFAQKKYSCYAVGFYEREGFRICSEEFLEDEIPHVQMVLQLKKRMKQEKTKL